MSSKEKMEIVVKPDETEVSGDMEECFEVVDREYKSTEDGIITVEIERTDEDLPFDLDGRNLYSMNEFSSSAYVQVGFGIEFLDKDGNIIEKVKKSYDPKEAVDLVKLKPDRKGSIRFKAGKDAKNAVSFRITSVYQEGGSSDSRSSAVVDDDDDDDDSGSSVNDDDDDDDDDAPASSSRASSSKTEDWDSFLDSYEQYVDEYIEYAKKVSKGDNSAMSKLPSLMEKTQNFNDKLSNAKGDMSPAQWARYMKITSKMSAAAASM